MTLKEAIEQLSAAVDLYPDAKFYVQPNDGNYALQSVTAIKLRSVNGEVAIVVEI